MMSMYVHREEWIVMQLELTEKEFRRLLDMVYICLLYTSCGSCASNCPIEAIEEQ